MSWWHFWKGFISSKAVEKQDGGSSRAHGTYMISVRLQLLPTGLISMLSYFLGLMYSEVVLAHLQLRFPFTSRMAERERRWQLTSTDSAVRDAATPGAKGSFPSRVFTDSTAGTTVRSCHLRPYLSSLLPHCSQKLNQTPAKDGRASSLATRQALG